MSGNNVKTGEEASYCAIICNMDHLESFEPDVTLLNYLGLFQNITTNWKLSEETVTLVYYSIPILTTRKFSPPTGGFFLAPAEG